MLRFLFILIAALLTVPAHADRPFIERPLVQHFITDMVKKHKLSRKELTALFTAVKERPQVMRSLRKPLEKEPWHLYQRLFISEWRIQHGVKFWEKYADALKRAEKQYGVPAGIIVATIGIESKYGERTGEYRVVDALVNIGFSDSPRAAYFRRELEEFLLLTKEEHLNPLKVMGSYAGAIGQPQFMPSAYRAYAVNFSGSGKKDLMNSEVDVIGSIANYYKKHGWKTNAPVAVEAALLGDRYHYLLSKNKITPPFSIKELASYGVIAQKKIASKDSSAKVIELDSRLNKEYWLGFENFAVIKRYNASDLYAMAVFQLGTYITELRNRLQNGK